MAELVSDVAKADEPGSTVPANSAKSEGLFNGVYFCLCDDVKDIDEIKKILVEGGGKLVNYLSDIVTHLIAENADHPDVTEAVEIYEKPVVTTKWVRTSLDSGKLLPVGAYSPSKNQLFSSLVVCISNLEKLDIESLWAMVTYYGGTFKLQLDNTCTHLITTKPEGVKYEESKHCIKVVTPDWVTDCIKNKQLCDEEIYQPKLLVTFCTRPGPHLVTPEPLKSRFMSTSPQTGIRNAISQSPGSRQVRIFSQTPVKFVQIPKSAPRMTTQTGQLTVTQTQLNPEHNQNWLNQQQGSQQLYMNRPHNPVENRIRFDGSQQQMHMSPRNQVFLSLQQQPQVRQQQQQQLNFVQVRQVQSQQQYQQIQTQNQTSQKPNVILQQRVQPPVHTLSVNQQQQHAPSQPNMIIQTNQPQNHLQFHQNQQQQQQMIPMQRHPEMGQQIYRQNFSPRAGFVGQPRVARVPQMRISQLPGPQARAPMPCGPQQMMTQFSPDPQRMNLRQQMDMNQQTQMLRQPGQQQMVRNQSWNEMSPQVSPQMMRGPIMPPSGPNYSPQNYNQQMLWSSQPSNQPQPVPVPPPPVTPHEGRGSKSPRSGEKRNSSNLSSPKSGTLSSVSSASITCTMGSSTPANSALVTSKTKTALANLLNTRLQNSGPITHSSTVRNYHDPPSVTFSGGASNCTSSSSSSTSTPTSLTAPPVTLPPQLGDGPSALISCCPLSPSNRLVCVGTPGVILPTGEVLHRGLLDAQPVQERYVGHDPSVTIPSDLCLIKCTFFITGYLEGPFILTAKQRELMSSRIRRSGGEVETVYSSKVTHVMCDMQDAPGVEQAIRDGKRLVTVYWLDAVIKQEKKLKAPWKVIHLPRSPRYIPAKDEIVSSTGFSITERNLIREVCIQIGALYTPYFSTKNTVLICKKLEGEKYTRATEWCIPVVNFQWLNDVTLGVNDAMKKPYGSNLKHKNFDITDPFDLCDTLSIRDIMIGWTQPIRVSEEELNKAIEQKKQELTSNIPTSESEQEQSKESDDDVFAKPSAKKMRVSENVAPDGIKKTEEHILPPPPPLTLAPFATVPFKVMFSGTDKKEKSRLEAIVKRLGAKCTTKYAECTHLVVESAVRTVKFLCALNHASNIVSKSWLIQSDENNSFVNENGHELQEIKPALAKRKERGEKSLLDKKVIYITPGCIPSPIILNEIINNAGGTPVTSRGPTSNQLDRMKESGLDFLILAKKETDIHLIEKYLDRGVTCLNPEWLLSSVMAQTLCPYSDFQISKD